MDKSTKMFDSFKTQKTNKQILKEVYDALEEKDYNPVDQLVVTSFPETRLTLQATIMREL